MSKSEQKWHQYYSTGQYKGFHKIRETQYKLMGKTHLTFSNGQKEVFAAGSFAEEALANIFRRIDRHVKN